MSSAGQERRASKLGVLRTKIAPLHNVTPTRAHRQSRLPQQPQPCLSSTGTVTPETPKPASRRRARQRRQTSSTTSTVHNFKSTARSGVDASGVVVAVRARRHIAAAARCVLQHADARRRPAISFARRLAASSRRPLTRCRTPAAAREY